LKTGGAMRRAMDLIDATNRETEKHPNQLMSCTTAADIRRAKKRIKSCVLMASKAVTLSKIRFSRCVISIVSAFVI
jgi:hypothetical protein